jgi:hypothetical protein
MADGARAALGRSAIIWERSAGVAALLGPRDRAGAGLKEEGQIKQCWMRMKFCMHILQKND